MPMKRTVLKRSAIQKLAPYFRLQRLIPLMLVVIAGGLALFAAPVNANEGGGEASNDKISNNRTTGVVSQTSDDVVGSGHENLYVPKTTEEADLEKLGEALYVQGCSTCHGLDGAGNPNVPSLQGVGAAAVDFFVGTGRMPLPAPVKQSSRKDVVYTQDQIDAIAAYVSTQFGGGPAVPKVNLDEGDEVEGNLLYANNCAQCHNSAGSGGALGRDYWAPNLHQATPTQIAEAIRVGPGAMPVWGENTLTDQQVNSIVKYVDHFKEGDAPGGLKLGSTGPVPEGYVAWVVGLIGLLGIARWIGTRV